MTGNPDFPIGQRISLPGHFPDPVILESVRHIGAGYECRVRLADGSPDEAILSASEADAILGCVKEQPGRVQTADAAKASPEEVAQARIGAARIRALRRRLRLSQAELGQILGVSGKTVLLWEKKDKLYLRDKARAAVVSAMKLNAKEARRKIELLVPKPVAKKRKGRRKKK